MKKALVGFLTLMLLLFSLPLGVLAEGEDLLTTTGASDLPFELNAPQNVTLAYSEDTASWGQTAHGVSYTVPNDMNQFLIGLEEAEDQEAYLAGYGYYEFYVSLQMDWALDDVDDPVSGWHYNEYWDYDEYFGFGRDSEGRYHYSEWDIPDTGLGNNDSIQDFWVFPGLPNDSRWNGDPETGWVGVKDQLNPDQYTYTIDPDGEGTLYIDMSKHTFYVRMRFAFWGTKLDGENREVFAYSDWSNIASSGKDGEKFELPTSIPKPEISNLRLTDETFNGNPVCAFTLSVPDDLAALAAQFQARNGGIWIDTQARVKGDTEWTEMGNSDFTIKTGEMTCALLHLVNIDRPTIPEDTPIELRCRYRATGAGLDEDLYSPWSEVLSFGTDEINQGGGEGETAEAKPTEPAEPAKNSCPICHFCPQPLGLCIFIWLLIILLVLVIIIVIIVVSKKKKKENK